jgi:hypothetical protein
MLILGIQLTMKLNFSEEKEINLNQQNQTFNQEVLSFYYQEVIKEEELLY